jgi:hypothetical protein
LPEVHKKVQFKLGSAQFLVFAPFPDAKLDLWSGSAPSLNLGPYFGLVLKSSGSNFGSEPDCSLQHPYF